jgi:hypothetical protein
MDKPPGSPHARCPVPFGGHFSVLITPDVQGGESRWIAQCLEVDIASQGRTIPDAMYELSRMIAARILTGDELGIDPFAGVPAAPMALWDRYRDASPLERSPRPAFTARTRPRPMSIEPELVARVA